MSLNAGIDVGGTNIQTTLFDDQWSIVDSKRSATPQDSYVQFLLLLAEDIKWIQASSTDSVGIGVGMPGIINPANGLIHSANLCANGHTLAEDLYRQTGVKVRILNDSKAFAYSEALLGSGMSHRCVLGISIGTGMAGGVVVENEFIPQASGVSGEFGHLAMPASVSQRHDLPVLPCGCGQAGCYETFLSGPGFERLGKSLFGAAASVEQWVEKLHNGDKQAHEIFSCWFALLAALINDLCLCFDPDCIVFGGGMSRMPRFIESINDAVNNSTRIGTRLPEILLASAAEHSGARGAALYASRYDAK